MKTTSIKHVLMRVLRTARDLNTTYYTDCYEWIAQGLAQLYTPTVLLVKSKVLSVKNHVANLPCDFIEVIAVEYCGQRLLMGSDVTAYQNGDTTNINRDYSEHAPFEYDSLSGLPYRATTQKAEYYREVLDVLQFSFQTGEITLHYRALQVDDEGYPLIPDVEELKNALFYYTLMCLTEAGWESKVFNPEYCRDLFENVYAPRAINKLNPFTEEHAQRMLNAMVRFTLPQHIYEDFGKNIEQRQEYRTHVPKITIR